MMGHGDGTLYVVSYWEIRKSVWEIGKSKGRCLFIHFGIMLTLRIKNSDGSISKIVVNI